MDPSGSNSKLSVSPLLTLQFSNLVIQGDILITNVLPEILTASAEVGIDWEGWWCWGGIMQRTQSGVLFGFCRSRHHWQQDGVLVSASPRTIWIIISAIVIAVQPFAVSMVKTEMLSSDTNKNRLDKSHEYFSIQSSLQQQQQQKETCSVQRTSKNPHASLLISISYYVLLVLSVKIL